MKRAIQEFNMASEPEAQARATGFSHEYTEPEAQARAAGISLHALESGTADPEAQAREAKNSPRLRFGISGLTSLWAPRLSFGFSVCIILMLATIARSQSRSPAEPELRDNGTLSFTVQGEFRTTKPAAEESALHAAQEQMRAWLSKQNPPIYRVPSLESIRRDKMIQSEKTEVETVLNEKMYKMTVTAELKPNQMRELRKRDRAFGSLWIFGGALVLLGVVSLGFRVDEWTKGYLTRPLVAGGIAVIVITIAALLWFIRVGASASG